MSIDRKNIKFNGRDIKIPININTNYLSYGQQEDIDNYVEEKTGLSINNIVDGERIPFNLHTSRRLYFRFLTPAGNFISDLRMLGFTLEELNGYKEVVLKSFFIVEVFDTFKSEIQNKLSTNYFSGFDFLTKKEGVNLYESTYLFDPKEHDFTSINLSNNFIKDKPSNFQLYFRYSFYNAKTGELVVLKNGSDSGTDDESYYVKFDFKKESKTYNTRSTSIYLDEEAENVEYNNRFNNTLDSLDLKVPTYPNVNIFNTETGKYTSSNSCGLFSLFQREIVELSIEFIAISILGDSIGEPINNNVEISAVPTGDPRIWNNWNLNTTPNYMVILPRNGETEITIRDIEINNQCIVSRVLDNSTQNFIT